MSKFLISIVGPTAIGKTAHGIAIAKHFNTEILSADSRQFYREMSIGTAAPTPDELKQVKHHFVHHKSINEDYSVGDFERDAQALLKRLFDKHDVVVLVGGSGLFVKAITSGLDDFPNVDKKIRKDLNLRLQSDGLKSLQEELKIKDFDAYNTIAIDNPRRVLRALEICIGSGQPYSSFLGKTTNQKNYEVICIGLQADRRVIYQRINDRVDNMINSGLLDEVKSLLAFQNLNALNTVGYKELFKYINGEWELDHAISEIKKNTRRFAKRQLTWFNKDLTIDWFHYQTPYSEIISHIASKIKEPT